MKKYSSRLLVSGLQGPPWPVLPRLILRASVCYTLFSSLPQQASQRLLSTQPEFGRSVCPDGDGRPMALHVTSELWAGRWRGLPLDLLLPASVCFSHVLRPDLGLVSSSRGAQCVASAWGPLCGNASKVRRGSAGGRDGCAGPGSPDPVFRVL